MKHNLVALCVILLARVALAGQSQASLAAPQTFHIQGTVYDHVGKHPTMLTFTNEQSHQAKVISLDERGSYEADLPFGAYSTTIEVITRYGFSFRSRPFRFRNEPVFRVTSPKNIVLDLDQNLQPRYEIFLAPSEDDIPFDVWIYYGDLSQNFHGMHNYKPEHDPRFGDGHVHVKYNLFHLQANHARYFRKEKRLEADGDVLIRDENGQEQHAQSVVLRFENGMAVPQRIQ